MSSESESPGTKSDHTLLNSAAHCVENSSEQLNLQQDTEAIIDNSVSVTANQLATTKEDAAKEDSANTAAADSDATSDIAFERIPNYTAKPAAECGGEFEIEAVSDTVKHLNVNSDEHHDPEISTTVEIVTEAEESLKADDALERLPTSGEDQNQSTINEVASDDKTNTLPGNNISLSTSTTADVKKSPTEDDTLKSLPTSRGEDLDQSTEKDAAPAVKTNSPPSSSSTNLTTDVKKSPGLAVRIDQLSSKALDEFDMKKERASSESRALDQQYQSKQAREFNPAGLQGQTVGFTPGYQFQSIPVGYISPSRAFYDVRNYSSLNQPRTWLSMEHCNQIGIQPGLAFTHQAGLPNTYIGSTVPFNYASPTEHMSFMAPQILTAAELKEGDLASTLNQLTESAQPYNDEFLMTISPGRQLTVSPAPDLDARTLEVDMDEFSNQKGTSNLKPKLPSVMDGLSDAEMSDSEHDTASSSTDPSSAFHVANSQCYVSPAVAARLSAADTSTESPQKLLQIKQTIPNKSQTSPTQQNLPTNADNSPSASSSITTRPPRFNPFNPRRMKQDPKPPPGIVDLDSTQLHFYTGRRRRRHSDNNGSVCSGPPDVSATLREIHESIAQAKARHAAIRMSRSVGAGISADASQDNENTAELTVVNHEYSDEEEGNVRMDPIWVMRDTYLRNVRQQEDRQQSREFREKRQEEDLRLRQQRRVQEIVNHERLRREIRQTPPTKPQTSMSVDQAGAPPLTKGRSLVTDITYSPHAVHKPPSSGFIPVCDQERASFEHELVSETSTDESDVDSEVEIKRSKGKRYLAVADSDTTDQNHFESSEMRQQKRSVPPGFSSSASSFSSAVAAKPPRTSASVPSTQRISSSAAVAGDYDTDEETDELLAKSYQKDQNVDIPELHSNETRQNLMQSKKAKVREVTVPDPDHPTVMLEGVLFRAGYLGSTQLISEGQPSKSLRMMQAQDAVGRIKAPEGESQPRTEVDLFVSTEKIMVLNTNHLEIMMDHALRTISYIADIDTLVVVMIRRRMDPEQQNGDTSSSSDDAAAVKRIQSKILCHVFESDEAPLIAQSIGQAFQIAYMEFLKANGIEDPSVFGDMDYQEVLNQQEIFGEELELFSNKKLQKDVIVPKQKGESLGIVVVESGWGSMVPTVVLANMLPTGPAARCGAMNIGDQLMSVNGISLVGLPLSTCQNYIKAAKSTTVVHMNVVPCPPVVEVLIKRPDLKYQLGFSVQNGVICSLLRGGIAERGGIRVGHRIIEIAGESVVAVAHEKIVAMLSNASGEIHMKTMPNSIFRLLTGQDTPYYI